MNDLYFYAKDGYNKIEIKGNEYDLYENCRKNFVAFMVVLHKINQNQENHKSN